jgi:hypothetical protein
MFLQWPGFLSPNWPENLVRKYQYSRSLEAREARGHSTETLAKHTQLSSQSVVEAAIDRNRDVHVDIKIITFTRVIVLYTTLTILPYFVVLVFSIL